MATLDRRGTIAIGRPLPIRAGQTISAVVISASRAVAGAATYTRSGATAVVNAPSASRSVTPLGTAHTRAGTVAVGRIPNVRAGATVIGHTLSGSRILGNPGAQFDRTATVIVGRIAISRSGTIAADNAPAGSQVITPAGVVDRTGGNAGGAGQPSGLLLALQIHPGATLSASRTLGTTVPSRSGAVTSRAVPSVIAVLDLSRAGTAISAIVVSGARVSSGNQNRNGTTGRGHALSATRITVHTNDVAGTILSSPFLSASAGIGGTPVYSRTGATISTPVVIGRYRIRRPSDRTYTFAPITTGHIANPIEDGVVVS